MKLALTILALCCVVGLPFFIVWLSRKSKIIGMIGAVACCYVVGFAFSALQFAGIEYDKGLISTVAYVLVALSIPLILFSIDLRALKKLTKGTVVGFALCIVSAVVVAVSMFFITLTFFPSAKISAMIVGLYTGGTPNLNAIGAALDAGDEAIAAANVSDTLVGGVYFLFLISLAPAFYRLFLGKWGKRKKPLESPEFAKTGGVILRIPTLRKSLRRSRKPRSQLPKTDPKPRSRPPKANLKPRS